MRASGQEREGEVDLESLKREIKDEIQQLDHRRAALLEKMTHLRALETSGIAQSQTVDPGRPVTSSSSLNQAEELPRSQPETSDGESMLAALRCLNCGGSLRKLVPTNSRGEPSLGSPRLGKSDGGGRYLECPQCQAKNIFVRTTGPCGWRLLVTQLKQ